jgi:adenylate kinase family enzyme
MIIHISGTSGSGKTTLGDNLKKIYKYKLIVIDTDSFIQHDTEEAKILQKIKNFKEYKKQWKFIIKTKIDEYINKYPNKTIIFTGLLNNWAIDDEPYKMHIQCYKYFINIPLVEILKRYYLRIYLTEQSVTKKQSEWYWNCLAKGECSVRSSEQISKNYEYDLKWHKKNGYKIETPKKIMHDISKLII